MVRLLLRCYPARWRARYGDEFEALLEERSMSPFDLADVLLGAIDAHLHLGGVGASSDHQKGFSMSLRLGGYAAILGGLLWFAGLFLGSRGELDGTIGLGILVTGTVALLVGLVGLSAFQARRYPRLTWAAFTIPALGAITSLAGMTLNAAVGDRPVIGELSSWYVWMFGTMALLIGSGLFAIVTWRTSALSRRAAALLAIGAIGTIALVPILMGVLGGPEQVGFAVVLVSVTAFAGGWVALGVSALRVHGTGARLQGVPS
jgi:hypothetical protein